MCHKHRSSAARAKSGSYPGAPDLDMEYVPEQLDLLIRNVSSTLGKRLEGLLKQQQNILDNHLNRLMIDHNGEVESITPDEIEGAYEIATIHNGHPGYFLWSSSLN